MIEYLKVEREAAHYGKHVLGEQADDLNMQGLSLLPLIRGEEKKLRDFAIAGYYGYSWSIIQEDYSFIHWVRKSDAGSAEETIQMVSIMYDLAGKGGGKLATTSQTEEMWSCTPGEAEVPEGDELYDRKADPFQLKNIIKEKPEIAKELLQKLKLYMAQLKAS